ncbi:MAG: hypothetical protein ACHBN1_34775 [Heteroscytonema crispum UTEX LB 1556]
MFWKFVVGALLLPICLGFEPATAFVNNKVDSLPHSENLTLLAGNIQTQSREYTSIPDNQEGDVGELEDTQDKHHYKRSRRHYHRYQECPQSDYSRRRDRNYHNGNYYQRVNHHRYYNPYHPNTFHRNRYQRLRHGRQHHPHNRYYHH